MKKENRQIPRRLIPTTVYVGLNSDWYYGWEGWAGEPVINFGLQPGKEGQFKHDLKRKDSVYVSTDVRLARAYSQLNSHPMILEINVNRLDKGKFYFDPLDVSDIDDPIQLVYRGRIPASAIRVKEAK